MKRIIVLALVICAVPMTARPQSVSNLSGNQLYQQCNAARYSAYRFFCVGYVVGFRDGVGRERSGEAKDVCIPASVSNEQLSDVVLRALKNAPETRHKYAGSLVTDAFAKAWPCK